MVFGGGFLTVGSSFDFRYGWEKTLKIRMRTWASATQVFPKYR